MVKVDTMYLHIDTMLTYYIMILFYRSGMVTATLRFGSKIAEGLENSLQQFRKGNW